MSAGNGNGLAKVPAWLAELGVKEGEYFTESKLPYRRIMGSHYWNEKQRVWACLRLATMGYQQELAVRMDKGQRVPLTPQDVAEQTGLTKQNVRRAIAELEEEGFAERKPVEGDHLSRGNVLIYCWANPRPPKTQNSSQRATTIFDALAPEFEPLIAFAKRWKITPENGIEAARDYLETALVAVRAAEEAQMVAVRAVERVCAPSRYIRKRETERNIERNSSSSSAVQESSVAVEDPPERPKPDEEEDSLFQEFKANYPPNRFDEGKTRAVFKKLSRTDQGRVLQRLRVYLDCDRWKHSLLEDQGRFVPLASNWIGQCDAHPPPYIAPPGQPNGKSERERREMDRHIEELIEKEEQERAAKIKEIQDARKSRSD